MLSVAVKNFLKQLCWFVQPKNLQILSDIDHIENWAAIRDEMLTSTTEIAYQSGLEGWLEYIRNTYRRNHAEHTEDFAVILTVEEDVHRFLTPPPPSPAFAEPEVIYVGVPVVVAPPPAPPSAPQLRITVPIETQNVIFDRTLDELINSTVGRMLFQEDLY